MIITGTIVMALKALLQENKKYLLILSSLFFVFLSIFHLNLRFPYSAHAKAFFGLSAIMQISIIFTFGFGYFDDFLRCKELHFARSVLYGWFGMLALTVFFSFFVS